MHCRPQSRSNYTECMTNHLRRLNFSLMNLPQGRLGGCWDLKDCDAFALALCKVKHASECSLVLMLRCSPAFSLWNFFVSIQLPIIKLLVNENLLLSNDIDTCGCKFFRSRILNASQRLIPRREFITFKFHLNHIKQIMLNEHDDAARYL
jgi:hypothetical protein